MSSLHEVCVHSGIVPGMTRGTFARALILKQEIYLVFFVPGNLASFFSAMGLMPYNAC